MTDIRRTEIEADVTPDRDAAVTRLRASWTPKRGNYRRLVYTAVVKDQGGGWLWSCEHAHETMAGTLACGREQISGMVAAVEGER